MIFYLKEKPKNPYTEGSPLHHAFNVAVSQCTAREITKEELNKLIDEWLDGWEKACKADLFTMGKYPPFADFLEERLGKGVKL